MLDAEGNIRDLSGVIGDIAGAALAPEMLANLALLDTTKLPQVQAGVRLGLVHAHLDRGRVRSPAPWPWPRRTRHP